MKKCLYCGEYVDVENDDYQKVGKKVVCVFCYEDYADEIDNKYYAEDEDSCREEE
jgi:hypothetical protein